MYTKFGNVFVCSNVNDLPVSQLDVGDHIVLLERVEEKRYFASEQVRNMVLHGKFHDRLLAFECVIQRASFNEDDIYSSDDEDAEYLGTKKSEGSIESSGSSNLYYVLFDTPYGERKAFLLPNGYVNGSEIRLNVYERTFEEFRNRPTERYGTLLEKIKDTHMNDIHAHGQYVHPWNDKTSGFVYLALPIAKDFMALFIMRLGEHKNTLQASKSLELMFITPNSVIFVNDLEVNLDFINRFTLAYLEHEGSKYFKKESQQAIDKFADIVKVLNTKVQTLMKEDRIHSMQRYLKEILPHSEVKHALERPFYHNEQTNVKAYSDIFYHGFVLIKDEKVYTDSSVQYEREWNNDDILRQEYRKVSALFNFLHDCKNGINPKDGRLYKDGEIVDAEDDIHYRNSYGVRFCERGYGYSITYYVLCDGYYVRANDSDGELTKRIELEYELSMKLSEVQP